MSLVSELGVNFTHDHFFRWNMAHLDTARAFFKLCLPADLYGRLDWSQLAPAKNDFLNHRLEEVVTDMLFSVGIDDFPCMLSLLVEHKSEGAMKKETQTLPFLMRRNEVRIMEEAKKRGDKWYPVIHLVGLYHGSRAYGGPVSVAETMNVPPGMIPERWLDPIHLVDLERVGDRLLLNLGRLGLFLLVLKHIYDADFLRTLKKMIPLIQEVDSADDGADFMEILFYYLFTRSRLENKQQLTKVAIESLKEESEVRVKSIAEQLIDEGIAKAELEFQEERRGFQKRLLMKDEALHRKDEALHRKDEALHRKDEALQKAFEEKKATAVHLLAKGFTIEDIAVIVGLDLAVVKVLAGESSQS